MMLTHSALASIVFSATAMKSATVPLQVYLL